MNVLDDIKIRNFKEEDFNTVIEILADSFHNKFHALTNLSNERIVQLLKDSGLIDRISFEGYIVGERNNKVQGVMLLKWKKQIRTRKDGFRFFELSPKYGLLNISKFILGLMLLEEELDADECYIEHIAVSSEARGLGVGTMLLDYGKELVRKTPYLNKYTLHVAANNKGAMDLYERLGFHVKKNQSSFLTSLLLKETGWYYMVWFTGRSDV